MAVPYVISVLVNDRVGILRDITGAVADLGANIDGISQTVVEGWFTVILIASFTRDISVQQVQSAIAARFQDADVSIVVRPHHPSRNRRSAVRGDHYVVTFFGPDQPGILKMVTAFLADKGINIDDWLVLFDRPRVTHIGAVTVPDTMDIGQLQVEFAQVLAGLNMVLSIQHENIFRATTKVGAIKSLLTEIPDAANR